MPYTPNPTWEDGSGGGTPITADTLNHLEAGLQTAAGVADTAESAASSAAQKSSNLSDLTDASAARGHLGLGTAATSATGDFDSAGAADAAASASQPRDTDLTTIAALDSSTTAVIASDGSGWVSKTVSQFRAWLGLATVAISGAYSDLTGKPTLGTLAAITPTGTPTGSKFLRDDDAWAVPAGSGLPVVNVIDYGAVHDGTTDDSTAINNAIAALPATGGIVYLPAGAYAVASTINIGDGTSSALSTRSGVYLRGPAGPNVASMSDITPAGGDGPASLKWTGSAGGTIVSVNGPLIGWGITNLLLLGNSLAAFGLKVISAQGGDILNLAVKGIVASSGQVNARCVWETTVPVFSGHLANTMHNSWRNIFLSTGAPGTSGWSTSGVLFDSADTSCNTCYETFINVSIVVPAPASGASVQAISFKGCDNVRVRDLHIACVTGGAGTMNLINYNYSGATTSWPADCLIDGVDFGSGYSNAAVNSGTPSGIAGNNRVVGIGSTNSGGTPPSSPGLTNLSWGYTASNP